jgi:hypothetical protein
MIRRRSLVPAIAWSALTAGLQKPEACLGRKMRLALRGGDHSGRIDGKARLRPVGLEAREHLLFLAAPKHGYAEVIDVNDLGSANHLADDGGIGGEICREVGYPGPGQALDHSADRGEVELPERHGHGSEDVVVTVLGATEGRPQSALSANIGARLNDLVGGGPNASKAHRLDDAVGGAAFDVALPSPGLSKALLDQGGCLSPGLEQIVNWLSQRLARAEAVDLR